MKATCCRTCDKTVRALDWVTNWEMKYLQGVQAQGKSQGRKEGTPVQTGSTQLSSSTKDTLRANYFFHQGSSLTFIERTFWGPTMMTSTVVRPIENCIFWNRVWATLMWREMESRKGPSYVPWHRERLYITYPILLVRNTSETESVIFAKLLGLSDHQLASWCPFIFVLCARSCQ